MYKLVYEIEAMDASVKYFQFKWQVDKFLSDHCIQCFFVKETVGWIERRWIDSPAYPLPEGVL